MLIKFKALIILHILAIVLSLAAISAGTTTDRQDEPDRLHEVQSLATDGIPASVSITADKPAPYPKGTTVTFTANGRGGSCDYEYRFRLINLAVWPPVWTEVQPYSKKNAWTWRASTEGVYTVSADIRTAGRTGGSEASAFASASVSCPDLQPARIVRGGTPLYFPSIQDAYDVMVPGEAIQTQAGEFNETVCADRGIELSIHGGYACDYSSVVGITGIAGQLVFEPSAPTFGSSKFFVDIGDRSKIPPMSVTLNSDQPSPRQQGIPVTFTATGRNGSCYFSYRFLLGKDGTWTEVQPFSNNNKWTWLPSADGTYEIKVEIRNELNLDKGYATFSSYTIDTPRQTGTAALSGEAASVRHRQ